MPLRIIRNDLLQMEVDAIDGWLGIERNFDMYRYVEDKEFLRRAQNCCSDLMHELEDELRENGINSQFFLVGSGARNKENGTVAIPRGENGNVKNLYEKPMQQENRAYKSRMICMPFL